MTTESRKKRNYTENFKLGVVALVKEQGYKTVITMKALVLVLFLSYVEEVQNIYNRSAFGMYRNCT